MYELKDYLNAINYTKEPLLDTEDEQWEKKYFPFIVNLSKSPVRTESPFAFQNVFFFQKDFSISTNVPRNPG